jgi:hypothetical protein
VSDWLLLVPNVGRSISRVVDGDQENHISVLLDGEESLLAFVDPANDVVSEKFSVITERHNFWILNVKTIFLKNCV